MTVTATVINPFGTEISVGPTWNSPIRGTEPCGAVMNVLARSVNNDFVLVEMEHTMGWVDVSDWMIKLSVDDITVLPISDKVLTNKPTRKEESMKQVRYQNIVNGYYAPVKDSDDDDAPMVFQSTRKEAALSAIPKQVKVGPITYDIVEEARTAINGKYGAIIYSDSVITLTPGMSPQHKAITLWHEMIHALLIQSGFTDHDERIQLALSHGIVQLLQDNEDLRK